MTADWMISGPPGSALGGAATMGSMSGGSAVAAALKRLFLELSPEETRQLRCSELLSHASDSDAAACLPLILDRMVNFPSTHGLGTYALNELLKRYPAVFVRQLVPSRVYDLFHPSVDDGLGAGFLHSFLCYKESQGYTAEQESQKLQKLLLRRCKGQDLRKVPASPLRAWLCKIWLDVRSARPRDNQLLVQCCARWVADPNASLPEKLPCLALMMEELTRQGRPEADAKLVSLLLEQICRDPVGHSPDLQQFLWLLGDAPSPTVLRPLLSNLAEERGRLVTLWVCLCLWLPQAQVSDGISPKWPMGSAHPVHAFIRTVLLAFAQFSQADELCRTCLLSLAAIAASSEQGAGALAAASAELLLLLHRDGPLLSSDVWMPLIPILEGLCARAQGPSPAAELLQRLSEAIGGGSQQQQGQLSQQQLYQQQQMYEQQQLQQQQQFNGMEQQMYEQQQLQQQQQQFNAVDQQMYEQQQLQQQQQFNTATGPGVMGSNPAGWEGQNGFAGPGTAPWNVTGGQAHGVNGQGCMSGPSGQMAGPNGQMAYQGGAMPQPQAALPGRGYPSQPGNPGVPITFEPPRVGLQNINNTCYMNSFIQALYMTNSFVRDIYGFNMTLKKNPSKVDIEDFDLGKKLIGLMQRHLAKMLLTRHPHTDIAQLLDGFPDIYRSGEQQDVTETIRFVFDKFGGQEQALIRDTFAGELKENTQCQECGNVRGRPETFCDLILKVPPEDVVLRSGALPTAQALLNQHLQFEMMDDDNLIHCERCNKNTKAGKWCEIVSPPAHLCVCLNRFAYDVQKQDFTKEKTPVAIDGTLQIGPFLYDLYMVIVHTGKDAASGHYYAIGSRAEPTEAEQAQNQRYWFVMDDSQLKPADMSLLSGLNQEKKDDNPYVLFYRCQQAPPTPQAVLPKSLVDDVMQEDARIQIS